MARARDILEAVRVLRLLERERRAPEPEELGLLARFGGFGPVALQIFPDPVTGRYRSSAWQAVGEELEAILTPEEYGSARRSTFNAFYTSRAVIAPLFEALEQLGVPKGATVLEPGCGAGRFLELAPWGMHFIGIELDQVSGQIARALHPEHDVRIEDFRYTKLPPLDAVIGNVPFADLKIEHRGQRFSLHDFFFAKSADSLVPGGILALVTSRFTLDKQNAAAREYLAARADFLGAIRLPSDAFRREGTEVVSDIVFLRRRDADATPAHVDPEWLGVAPLAIEGAAVSVNRYFLRRPEMVLGDVSRKDTLYGEGLSVLGKGELATLLRDAIRRLPTFEPSRTSRARPPPAPSFVPPPPVRHVTEGSLFVGDDNVIRQVVDGRAQHVTYFGILLRADGTLQARRIASLIGLRDTARRVLQSQNEGWPIQNRDAERAALRLAYDRFVTRYGPINKTTLTETKTGTIRRMPNLVKFREDPDAMLVMALEEYDEASGRAEKAPIMSRDVVGPRPEITSVPSAEEGLLVSLDRKGTVDLSFIASLYGRSEREVVHELGELIHRDPETGAWETADAYLSGDVRKKLLAAERAGEAYTSNVEALRAVQPEDILPGDIDANLGAPWIPAEDIRAFAEGLFGGSIKVDHLEKEAIWSIEPDYHAAQSVAAMSDFGTSRAIGTTLLELALNLRTPVVYDVVMRSGREDRVVNQDETLAAREKQRAIKDRFKSWVFSDPERTEKLVRIYNDTYNNLRPRVFDGSHLEFPGKSAAITLRHHQADAVWRCMSGGNTLLAHAVGAGKTISCCAAAMKMRQAGLVKKPMIAVPNHMLEQFSREFLQLYPNARILAAGRDDMARDRRKQLTARIASGDWDAIIVTHSGFERIAMSREFQAKFLRAQIAEYEVLLVDRATPGRNIIKALEKQKAAREERLKTLIAEEKKDDGLVFDELGVDQLFIDEIQYHKNLEMPTKMDRVAGIQTGGSERAFDLYMKARYLEELHPGRGLVGASGTPVSNSMVEMYTMQRFFDPAGLESRGIEHFDAWAATFGEVVDAMEISPDGATLKPRSRFARFINLPELSQMFRSFADVQTADMLDLPRPRLEGERPHVISCPMSDAQRSLQDKLVRRYERIRNERVDPREDNALAITTDGRKLALDGRMLEPGLHDFPDSKINALARNVFAVWERTAAIRGAQLVFCDMGVNPNPFSAYDAVIEKLTTLGIPRRQIAVIGEADSDARKQSLFEQVRSGFVRVLMGSTQKMGTGTNVQRRLVALHHLDAPWKPAEVEQRDGRILRQGNENEEVSIYRYVTEGSFDAFMWQALETKARFIAQVMAGDIGPRRAEDIGSQELSYAEVKAIASGNPAVLTLSEADAELQRLSTLRKHHADEQFLARRSLRELPETIARISERIACFEGDLRTMAGHDGGDFRIGERPCRREAALALLASRLESIPELVLQVRKVPLGMYRGLLFGLVLHPHRSPEVYLEGTASRQASLSRDAQGPRAVLNAVERIASGYESRIADDRDDLAIARGQLRDYEARLGRHFPHDAYIDELSQLRDLLRAVLSGKAPDGVGDVLPPAPELADRIRALRAANAVEAQAEPRTLTRIAAAERPVTARIRERQEASGGESLAGDDDGGVVPLPPRGRIEHGPMEGDVHAGNLEEPFALEAAHATRRLVRDDKRRTFTQPGLFGDEASR
jgi:N12 class adenine-specific DNA methylase